MAKLPLAGDIDDFNFAGTRRVNALRTGHRDRKQHITN